MNFKFFKEISKSDILIIPNAGNVSSVSKKIKTKKVVIFFIIYTFIIALLGFVVFTVTPLKYWIFPNSTPLTKADMQKVELLNKRLLFLDRELEDLKTTNQRLKDAIILGDSALIDSLKIDKNKSSEKKISDNELGGNLFYIIKEIFSDEKKDTEQTAKESSEKTIFFEKPIDGFISRGFDPDRGHMGIDFVAKLGTPVYASANGFVIFSDYTERDGYTMIVGHSQNYLTIYKHCSVLLKKERDTVLQGEIIALSGNSGETSTGPHLHFEIWKDGQPIDPEKVLIKY
jgi:murein DD-endopeptidase MepM/ murein hydrolase activator NlpD